MGGVIEKPITRPGGADMATALDSCYIGRSGPSGFDKAAGWAVRSPQHIRNLKSDTTAAQIACSSLHLQAVRPSVGKALSPSHREHPDREIMACS